MPLEPSTANKLFHNQFWVQIPQEFLYSETQVRLLGVPSSGDKAVDKEMRSAPVDTYLTVAAMAEFFDEGCPIRFHKPTDIPVISSLILEHLKNWAYIFSNVYPMTHPPLEDFVKFDNLAAALHPMVSAYGNKVILTGLAGRLAEIRVNSISRTKGKLSRLSDMPPKTANTKPNGYKSSLNNIISKLWGPEYEHSRNKPVEGDSAYSFRRAEEQLDPVGSRRPYRRQ